MQQDIISAQMTLVVKQSQEWEEVLSDTPRSRIVAQRLSTTCLNLKQSMDHRL